MNDYDLGNIILRIYITQCEVQKRFLYHLTFSTKISLRAGPRMGGNSVGLQGRPFLL